MSRLELAIEGPEGSRGRAFEAPRALWLGRDPGCDVVLASALVSRRHACIELVSGALRVRDCSANGMLVDGTDLHRAQRDAGTQAELEIGPYRVRIRLTRTAAETAIPAALRRRIQRRLLDHLDLARLSPDQLAPDAMRPQVRAALERICEALAAELPDEHVRRNLIDELTDEAVGLGPLQGLLSDPGVSEIMVVDPNTIFVERGGVIVPTALRFTDADAVRAVIERIITPLGRRIDDSSPVVDARLADGSRVHAIIPPLARRGPCITIRKFKPGGLSLDDLVAQAALSAEMAELLACAVRARKNIVVSGGTGSGKTTLLNALSAAIPQAERIVTIEDAAELRLRQPHVVSLESRPSNLEGSGAYPIRELVRNALRMRPDRILVGECRGGEAIDMLQAMNTGHEGSMTTTHANSPREAVARLETLSLMAGLDLPVSGIRRQIASSIHLIVQQARFADGSRRVTAIGEVAGLDEHGEVELAELFQFERERGAAGASVRGMFRPSGRLPAFAGELARHGWGGDGGRP